MASYNLNAGSNIIVFGDSLTEGAGVTSTQVWHYIYANLNAKGWYNAKTSQSGRTLQTLNTNSPANNSLQYVRTNNALTTLPVQADGFYAYDPLFAYAFFSIGINDVLQSAGVGNTTANFITEFTAEINLLISNGWSASKIKVLNLTQVNVDLWATATSVRIASYNAAVATVCTTFGIQLIDINTWQNTQPNWTANTLDGLHWSASQHAALGNYVASQVGQLSFRGKKVSFV